MDDKGQMMVFEAVFFAATVILSLFFIYQMSPSSIIGSKYTNDLKITGDGALYVLYNDVIIISDFNGDGDDDSNYRYSKMEHYLITNSYSNFISDLNNLFPSNVMYNIYIDNGITTEFWCSSTGNYWQSLPSVDPITISHCIVSIHPYVLIGFNSAFYNIGKYDPTPWEAASDLYSMFIADDGSAFDGSTYEITLEMWYK